MFRCPIHASIRATVAQACRDCACDVRLTDIQRRRTGKGANPFRSFSDIGMPAREPDGTNRKVFPSKMAEAEEIQSRIETIKDLSDRLAEQDRTIKDLEEEMRSETPEHPWSFMKMRRHNRLHAEIEDERTSMSRDRYDLNRLTERLFEDVNIIADKATSTNSLELILDLVEQSLDTDPKYRENVRKQAGVTDGMSYMRLVPQDNPQGMLPPTPWGRKAAEEAYRQDQVQRLDPQLKLLRTLATGSCKDHDTPETNDYLALMDFNEGDQVTMGPGLSTTVTTPHWLGAGGILLIIEGVSKGVPMVGSRGGVSNESEVFIPDVLHCTVMEKTTDGEYLGKEFERIYQLGVESEESPIPKRDLLEFPSIQPDVPLPDPAIGQDTAVAGPNDPGLGL